MYRAFLSLYLLIALSLLVTGWGLDKLWHHYNAEPVISTQDKDMMRLVELHLTGVAARDDPSLLNQQTHAVTSLIPLEDFAQSQMLRSLLAGATVVVNDEAGNKLLYRRLGQTGQVVRLEQAQSVVQRTRLYDLLIIAFYAAMALVVLFWIWPLSRDLGKLEKQTRLVGKDLVPGDMSFSAASPVRDLASAFNGMSRRIRDLLVSHQEMTCAVSHELRTPLARMKFGLELASDSSELSQVHRHLEGVRQDVTEMDRLISQLLTYVTFEQGDQQLNLQAGDLGFLLTRLTEQLNIDIDRKALTLSVQDHLQQPVVCEWHLMERAILNILQNAIRYARQQIVVVLACDDGKYCVRIEDDGPGIPAAERTRIFNSFVRLNHDAEAPASGFGLGLAIVRRIMAWHGGTATAGQSPLGGAAFMLQWPAGDQPDRSSSPSREAIS